MEGACGYVKSGVHVRFKPATALELVICYATSGRSGAVISDYSNNVRKYAVFTVDNLAGPVKKVDIKKILFQLTRDGPIDGEGVYPTGYVDDCDRNRMGVVCKFGLVGTGSKCTDFELPRRSD